MLVSATHVLTFLLGLLAIGLVVCILVGIYFYRIVKKQPRRSSKQFQQRSRFQKNQPQQQSPNWFRSSKAKHLERELLSLLGGDQNTLQRLLSYSQEHNRDKSIEWHLEKVKYDLERDRGAR
ncbi:hypothetical protein RIF25_05495 [Thermosynechococcaceae cyanobacterium BACA0444]|uniref:Uncharacterized protein n=1 Tax=Pseudocalidococcus azoricus BACA0444 TaxID=2918990 RepID=A0AAE4FSQ1_9CYAN|nr:hypothetical protein [Pseudocalidococcus azoricus]MDS3860256.1 hypothetical protein [Pseudocalidococcus azoricus BACA0444]